MVKLWIKELDNKTKSQQPRYELCEAVLRHSGALSYKGWIASKDSFC